MAHKSGDVPGSGIDKAPNKTLAEKLADTLTAIVKRSKKAGNDSADASARSEPLP
jgi:hypothetical protein